MVDGDGAIVRCAGENCKYGANSENKRSNLTTKHVKYKCPTPGCKARYYKSHKEMVHDHLMNLESVDKVVNVAPDMLQNCELGENELNKKPINQCDFQMDGCQLLTEDQKNKLFTNTTIREIVTGSKRLRNHIALIDGTKEDRERAKCLRKLRQSVPEFDQFLNLILEVVKD